MEKCTDNPRDCPLVPRVEALEDVSVRVRRPRKRRKPPGKLLSALLARREGQAGGSVFRWLEAVFTALLGRLRGRAASRGG